MPVAGWKGFPPEDVELVQAAKELLRELERQDHSPRVFPASLEAAEKRLDLAVQDFVVKNAIA